MLNNLITERKTKRLTQKELAKILNITEQHYQRLEAGTSEGSVPIWKTLSELFDCTINYLLEQNDDRTNIST